MPMKKHFCAILSSVAATSLLAGAAFAEDRVLKVTNWAEYIAEDTIANFEAEYGIKVIYDTYDSVESIDAKLLAGNSGYDVVSHSGSRVARLIKAGIPPLETSQLDNMKHMDATIMTQLGKDWDLKQYFMPYMWSTHGVTYNKELVLETYPDASIGSMDLIFDLKHMQDVAKCGVVFLISDDIFSMALSHLGLARNQKQG